MSKLSRLSWICSSSRDSIPGLINRSLLGSFFMWRGTLAVVLGAGTCSIFLTSCSVFCILVSIWFCLITLECLCRFYFFMFSSSLWSFSSSLFIDLRSSFMNSSMFIWSSRVHLVSVWSLFLLFDLDPLFPSTRWEFAGRIKSGGFRVLPGALNASSFANPSRVTTYGRLVVIADTVSVIALYDSTLADTILLLEFEPCFFLPTSEYFRFISSSFSFFCFANSSSASLVRGAMLFFSWSAFNLERLDAREPLLLVDPALEPWSLPVDSCECLSSLLRIFC